MIAANGLVTADGRVPYACNPAESRGRLYSEPESPNRTVFQRDRDRIIHSTAFRRLKHKTQVFVYHEGDHYRTRLTHSIEVAQIARSLSRALGLDEDLAEALALAHDLGHTPFGHAGEDALGEAMAPYGGFDHNGQSLRIVTLLEARYAEFDGLNLTWETLEGLAKHNGPLVAAPGEVAGLPWAVAQYARETDLELHTEPGLEAQIAALSDDIAYHTHDLDDGLRAGLFAVADLVDLPLVGTIIHGLDRRYPNLQQSRLIHETLRRMIDAMVQDLLAETRRRIAAAAPGSAAGLRALGRPLAGFSAAMEDDNRALKTFLFEHMYRHDHVNRMTDRARRVVAELFERLLAAPEHLPDDWRAQAVGPDAPEDEWRRARVVADYIAGMTDRYALGEHTRFQEKSD